MYQCGIPSQFQFEKQLELFRKHLYQDNMSVYYTGQNKLGIKLLRMHFGPIDKKITFSFILWISIFIALPYATNFEILHHI